MSDPANQYTDCPKCSEGCSFCDYTGEIKDHELKEHIEEQKADIEADRKMENN